MSKTKKNDVQQAEPKGMADVLKEIEGVSISEVNHLRITAPDGATLNERTERVVEVLAEYGDVTVSPLYGDAAAIGCVWYEIKVKLKR